MFVCPSARVMYTQFKSWAFWYIDALESKVANEAIETNLSPESVNARLAY